MKYYQLIFILLLFASCDVSTLTNKDVSNLGNLSIHVLITDGDKSDDLNNIKLRLTDGKKQIINEDIKVLLNDLPLELYVKNQLYYTKKSFYTTNDRTRKEAYYFEIILPDSSRHPLAYIQPKKRSEDTTGLSYKESGLINPELLTGSTISYRYEIEKAVNLK